MLSCKTSTVKIRVDEVPSSEVNVNVGTKPSVNSKSSPPTSKPVVSSNSGVMVTTASEASSPVWVIVNSNVVESTSGSKVPSSNATLLTVKLGTSLSSIVRSTSVVSKATMSATVGISPSSSGMTKSNGSAALTESSPKVTISSPSASESSTGLIVTVPVNSPARITTVAEVVKSSPSSAKPSPLSVTSAKVNVRSTSAGVSIVTV